MNTFDVRGFIRTRVEAKIKHQGEVCVLAPRLIAAANLACVKLTSIRLCQKRSPQRGWLPPWCSAESWLEGRSLIY